MYKNKYRQVYVDYFNELNYVGFPCDKECIDLGDNQNEEKDNADARFLCIDCFDNNQALIKKRALVRGIKKLVMFNVPFVSSLVAAVLVFDTPKKHVMAPVYTSEVTTIHDGNMSKISGAPKYYSGEFESDNVTDYEYKAPNDLKTEIIYQAKNNLNSTVVKIRVVDDNKLKVIDAENAYYYDLNVDVFEDAVISEANGKYKELADNIEEFLKNDASITDSDKEEIRTLLDQEKEHIIITITEYVKTGDIEIVESFFEWLEARVLKSSIIMLFLFIFSKFLFHVIGFDKMPALGINDSVNINLKEVSLREDETQKEPIGSGKIDMAKFVEADKNRGIRIKALIKGNYRGDAIQYFLDV